MYGNTAKYTAVIVNIILWSLQWKLIEGNPIVNIDCDCSATSLESDATACCISELPEFGSSSSFSFNYLVNASSTYQTITQLRLQSAKNLTEIPRQLFDSFPNLNYLEASIGLRSLSHTLPNNQLKQLNLGNNRINVIAESGAFDGLTKLNVLILCHNELTIVHRTTFNGANNLQVIDLSSNEIATIEDGAFNLPYLKEILISNNKLKRLFDNIFAGAPNLQNIDLQRNQLEHIGKAFERTQHLHQLQLSGNNHLEDLNVFALSNLTELISLSLDAIGIHSISIPSTVTSSQSPLHTLSLSQNHLSNTDFLKQLSIFSKIEKLFVDGNKFVRWDDADVQNIKKYFPHIELIVTKCNIWDRRWVQNSMIPVFQANNIFCSNIKYLNTYIEGFTNSIDGQIIEGTECI